MKYVFKALSLVFLAMISIQVDAAAAVDESYFVITGANLQTWLKQPDYRIAIERIDPATKAVTGMAFDSVTDDFMRGYSPDYSDTEYVFMFKGNVLSINLAVQLKGAGSSTGSLAVRDPLKCKVLKPLAPGIAGLAYEIKPITAEQKAKALPFKFS